MYVHSGLQSIPKWPLEWGPIILHADMELLARISNEFNSRREVQDSGLWGSIVGRSFNFTDALSNGRLEEASSFLNRLFTTSLTYGFEQHANNYLAFQTEFDLWKQRLLAIDRLLSLAESFGAIPLQNAEQGDFAPYLQMAPDTLIDLIEQKIGVELVPPSVVPGLFGLSTRRGLFTDRTITAFYVAYRIWHDMSGKSVCEIGGGVGYVAYWLQRFGVETITICDLPMVSAVQRYFLSKNGADRVQLIGMEGFEQRQFDIIVNVDSLPEIGGPIQRQYLKRIASYPTTFLSINQEACAPRSDGGPQERVSDVVEEIGGFRRTMRSAFFMRRGYVEEIYVTVEGERSHMVRFRKAIRWLLNLFHRSRPKLMRACHQLNVSEIPLSSEIEGAKPIKSRKTWMSASSKSGSAFGLGRAPK